MSVHRAFTDLSDRSELLCAYSRGWEAKRRGELMDSNPFRARTWQWESWRDGWLEFKPPELKTDPCMGK